MTHDVPPANLLADLESRQDELLRLLGELEERTKQALASLTAPAPAKPTVDAPVVVVPVVAENTTPVAEPAPRVAKLPRARSRKAA